MSMKASELAAWAVSAHENGWVYWYGTCGYACTESLLARKAKQYPAHYTPGRMARYRRDIAGGRVCADCIGLFKACAWDRDGDIATRESTYASNGHPDIGARTALSQCTVKGDITGIPEIPGLAVWTKTGVHIGVYVGGGDVVEARGFAYGVQRNRLRQRGFVTWGLYPFAEYTPEEVALAESAAKAASAASAPAYTLPTLRPGSKGNPVKVLQWLLNERGHAAGQADGIYGAKTCAAVKAFQADNGLTADGIAGTKTWSSLMAQG